jgi:hypothetical protein
MMKKHFRVVERESRKQAMKKERRIVKSGECSWVERG